MGTNYENIINQAKKAVPQLNGTIKLVGLNEEVTIIRDKWGIPHILAENLKDVIFAQGFIHAQDRLWQMDFFRRMASGTLSEILGAVTLNRDIFNRTIGLRRSAERDAQLVNEMTNDTLKEIYHSYASGVNSSIELQSESLPLEFLLLDYKPSKWTTADTIVMLKSLAWSLSRNWQSELLRSDLIRKLGGKRASEVLPFKTTEAPSVVPSKSPIYSNDFGYGSNSWVVDGTKSIKDKPMLANDPHLPVMIPSIWYENHLKCPELDVIGGSIASIPGVFIGHNKHIAWGVTTSTPDVQDFYLEKINPENNTALYNDEWEKIKVITEKIKVRGGKTVEKEIRITRHGPMLDIYTIGRKAPTYREIQSEDPLALKWTGHDSMADSLSAILKINQASNWDEFKKGLKFWNTPSQNFVYADIEGNIGFYMPGKVPIRRKGFGLVPVPGWNSEYEWDGYIPFDELPHSYNPSTNFLATANNKIVSDDYPYHLSHDWAPPYRIRRIVQLLTEKHKLTIDDHKKMQSDITSLRAEELVPFIVQVEAETKRQKKAQKMLKKWDYKLDANSTPALIYQVWLSKMIQNILNKRLGDLLFKRCVMVSSILHLLRYPSNYWFPGESNVNIENRDRMILQSLTEALDEIESLFGEDIKNWRWGGLHTITFSHVLSSLPGLSSVLNRGPLERGGDTTTINNGSYDPVSGFEQDFCASYRQIIDLSDFSQSVSTHTLGQSGHPFAKHYDDLLPLWHNIEYHPMLFEKKNIERNEERRLILTPK